jgi:superfamily II DNA helicase RecQ
VAVCRTSARDAESVRWRQYRAIWDYVERSQCRRAALLNHFGDASPAEPLVPCCDVCAPGTVPALGLPQRALGGSLPETLDQAIVQVVQTAQPSVGRTRTVEILRGGRSKVIAEHGYDGLPVYGAYGHLRADDVLGRVDELLSEGTLRSTGGRFPKLRAA